MAKSKVLQVFSTGSAILLMVLVFASCAAPAAPSEERIMLPAMAVIPNVVAPQGNLEYYGANFVPGEKVTVVLLMDISPGKAPPLEGGVAAGAHGLKVNATGSFYIKGGVAPEPEGVYGVRVYDEKGKVVASSAFLVKKPPEVKK